MPNPRYEAGRRQEYAVKKRFETGGYICIRSAGSRGAWDLVCLGPTNLGVPDVILVQVKRTASPAAARRLIRAFRRNPPGPEAGYTRLLEAYVTSTRETMTALIPPTRTVGIGDSHG